MALSVISPFSTVPESARVRLGSLPRRSRQLCGWGRRVAPWARLLYGIRLREAICARRPFGGVPGTTLGGAERVPGATNSSGAAGISRYVRLNCAFDVLEALCISCSRRPCRRMDLISEPAVSIGIDCFLSPSFSITNAARRFHNLRYLSCLSDQKLRLHPEQSGPAKPCFSFVATAGLRSPNSLLGCLLVKLVEVLAGCGAPAARRPLPSQAKHPEVGTLFRCGRLGL